MTDSLEVVIASVIALVVGSAFPAHKTVYLMYVLAKNVKMHLIILYTIR